MTRAITFARALALVIALFASGVRAQSDGGPTREPSAAPSGAFAAADPSVASASASPESVREEADRAAAQEHFGRALALIRQELWQLAIPELEATRAIVPTAAVLFNLGLAYRAIGDNRAAIAAFRALLSHPEITPARRAEVAGYAEQLTAALGFVRVQITPAESAVSIDGEPRVATGDEIEVNPGHHVLAATALDYRPASLRFDVAPGAHFGAVLRLAVARTSGHVRVESDVASADVFIDGRDVGTGTGDADLDPGTHRIEARAAGRLPFRDDVTLTAGSLVRVRARMLLPRSTVASPWFLAAIGVAVVGAISVGIAAYVLRPTDPPVPGTLGIQSTH